MQFDRFDICEAWYLFLANYHNGLMSYEYQRLSRLLGHFSPRPNLRVSTLTENGLDIYHNLVRKNGY